MCSECEIEYPDPEPQLFSFNNPIGACEVCQGFGHTIEIDMDLVVPDKNKSIKDGAVAPWRTPNSLAFKRELVRAAPKYKIPVNVPFHKLSKEHVRLVREGTDDFYGIDGFFKKLEAKQYKMHIRVLLSKYRTYRTCYSCAGTRLKQSALNVKINSFNIAETCSLNIEKASEFFKTLKLNKYEEKVSRLILNEIVKRLEYMVQVGLGYLTLDRLTRSLSGGESQRVNLTTSLGSSLVNTLYILDEPSIGLHARDTDRLIRTLTKLRDIGNTVIVVEHDKSIIRASDNVIDIGPGAGEKGGTVVFQGTIKDIASNTGKQKKFDKSLTVQYLLGKKKINLPAKRRKPTKKEIFIKGASLNNLKSLDVRFPLNLFICVTGVSGSGKSTLIHDTLYGAIKAEINGHSVSTGKYKSISGSKQINDVILVDQSPIGRTPRSNPITYVKVFDEVRKLFAGTKQARVLNTGAGHFSFNVPGGRCDNCEGAGQEKIEMQFLADIYVTCEYCQGKRFRKEILDIKYKEKNIYEVLSMTVDEALEFFEGSARISKGLRFLQDTGLGYLRLGQSATTLSGGEAQRLKLATFMAKKTTDRMLFIFDEPTTGLHFHDIRKLLACFNSLVDVGHSLIVIEHNLDVIKCSDYVIDLG
ncbi:MAG: excinuclease ABC subunit UvrA, partial [Candidatus Anammoxibacter sp.]